MNIRRLFNQNRKLVWYVFIIIVFAFFVIKALNFYYKEDEKKIKEKVENEKNLISQSGEEDNELQKNNVTESNSIEKTMKLFVNYCNNGNIENAYKMLTDEIKDEQYRSVEEFKNKYIKNVFTEEKDFSMIKWVSDGKNETYQVKFVGNILATVGEGNITEEFYTFIKVGDIYKINVNNYINRKSVNKEYEKSGVGVKISNINIYRTYEEYEISFTNYTSKEISLTGNKYAKNIYLKNSEKTTYSSLNSVFDNNEITLKPEDTKSYKVKFNKIYNPQNNITTLVLSDVIFDYEEYNKTDNKQEYTNRTSVEIKF